MNKIYPVKFLPLIFIFLAIFGQQTLVQAQISGTITIPSAGYPNLATAVTALNTVGVGTGGVIINITAGNPQTAPAGGYLLGSATLNASTSLTNTIAINGNGNTVTAPVGTTTNFDGIFIIRGTDYLSINALNLAESAANTTATTAMEYGYALFNLNAATPFDGCQFVTIQNCTVTMNRTIATPSKAIFVAHQVYNSTTALSVTATSDLHNNNKFYSNTLSNCITGIYIGGSTSANDTGNDIGGSSAATGNTMNNVIGALYSSVGAVTCTYQTNCNISYNTINNTTGGGTNAIATAWGIYAYGPSCTFTINNNSITLTEASISTAYAIYGIYGNAGAANITANNNTVTVSEPSGSAVNNIAMFLPNGNNTTITGNTVTQNMALSGTTYGIYITSTGTSAVNSNTIKQTTSAATSSQFYSIVSGGTGTSETIQNNIFDNSNVSVAGTLGYMTLIYTANGTGNKTISGNTINGTITHNSSSDFYGILDNPATAPAAGTSAISNNNFSGIAKSGTGGVYAIYEAPTAATTRNMRIDANTITNIIHSGTGQVVGVYYASGNNDSICNNRISDISGAGNVFGIYGSSPATVNAKLYKNKIYTLASTGTTGGAFGITLNDGTTNNVFNNYIGDLRAATTSSTSDAIRGISMLSTTANSRMNIYYNTVYLNASSSGANFSTSGIYHTANATATTAALDLRNNIIVNTSTASGTGVTAAYRRSGTASGNYSSTSNNNLFYAGTPAASKLIMYDGTNSYQTLAAYQAAVTARDAASITELPNFLSTTGSAAPFLHISTATATAIESGGTPIAGYTDDYDANIRQGNPGYVGGGTSPDIGADEFNLCNTVTYTSQPPASISICAGLGTAITIAAANATIYQWQVNTGSGFTNITNGGVYSGATTTTLSITGATASMSGHIYQCLAQYSTACPQVPSNSTTLTVNPTPDATITGGGVTVCASGTTLSGVADPNYTYVWGRSLTGAPFTNIGSAQTLAVTASGNYQLTVTNQFTCTATSSVTPVNVADYVFNGSITAADAQMTGRLNRFGVVSTCASPKACPGVFTTTGSRAYDSYTITNPRPVPVCATIGINTACGTSVFCVAYSGSFNPSSHCTNYLGDPGSSFPASGFYEVTIPANGTIVVVVHEVNPNTGCANYSLTVNIPRETQVIAVSPSATICSGSTVTLTAPAANSYSWTPGGATTQSINVIPSSTTPYSVVLGYGNAGCTNSLSQTITVNPTSNVNAVSDQTVCNGSTVNIPFIGSVSGTTYNWINSNTAIGLAASGSGNLNFIATNVTGAPVSGSITVTPVNGSCTSGTPMTFTITVNPTPSVNTISDQIVCDNSPITAIAFSSPTTGGAIVYNWTNSTPSIGLGASGTSNIASFNAMNATTAPVTATIAVTPSYTNQLIDVNQPVTGNCMAQFSQTNLAQSFKPTASTISGAGIQLNALGGSGNVTISLWDRLPNAGGTQLATGTVASAPNSWVDVSWPGVLVTPGNTYYIVFSGTNTANCVAGNNNNPYPDGQVYANSGYQSFPSFDYSFRTFYSGTVTCTGTPRTFTITVNPTATVNAVADQTVCNGTNTTAVNFSSPTTGGVIVYNWTNNTPSIGLAASGSGDIASFAATNATTAPVTAAITVTPSYTNGSVTCIGTPAIFTITVNPTATVNTITNQSVCNGASTTPVIFSSPATGGTIVYNWTNNTPSIGLAASGSGDIASFNAINATAAPVTATITVTASYTNGGVTCTGTPTTFTITVNPTATVNTVANQAVCNGTGTIAISFSSATTGGTIVYNWTNNTPSIGLAASGTGNIASFVATNTTGAPVTANITVTPSYTNGSVTCIGTSTTFTITVNPTATVNPVTNQAVCNGATTTAVSFSSPTTGGTVLYNWTNNTPSIGLAASGTGNIASFAATNTTSGPVTATITVTPSYTNGSVTCTGTATTFTITVNPTVTVNAVTSQTVCAGSGTTAISFTSATAGTTFNWTNNTPSIGLAASGTGNIASFTAINTGNTAVTATITVTPVANGCTGTPLTFTITVNALSTAPVAALSTVTTSCGPTTTTLSVSGGNLGTGASWKWYTAACGGTLIGTGATLNNVTVNASTTYFVRAEGGCNTSSCASVTVTINDLPGIVLTAAQYTSLLPGMVASLKATVSPPNTGYTYTWYRSGGVVAGATGNTLLVNVDALGDYAARVTTPAGCSVLSGIITIKDSVSDRIFIYPNPTNGQFKVKFYTTAQNAGATRTIVIYDAKGALVFNKPYTAIAPYGTMDIDIRKFSKGTYMLVLSDTRGKKLAEGKVVVQ
ncbi:MAG: hypothetical protein QM687_11310 [Ferruginibacter sp.]